MILHYPCDSYEDDESITDDINLYRMVSRSNFSVDGGQISIKSSAFHDSSDQAAERAGEPAPAMSVYIGSEMDRLGLTPEDLLELPLWTGGLFGVASITVGQVREDRQGVTRWPEPDNPAHGLVFTTQFGKRRRTRGQGKRLARVARTLILPTVLQGRTGRIH